MPTWRRLSGRPCKNRKPKLLCWFCERVYNPIMKVSLRWKVVVPIVLIAATLICSPGISQDVGRRYFGETGHWVSGDFLLYYESISNPEMLLGYPITDEFTYLDPNQPDQPEYQVQY